MEEDTHDNGLEEVFGGETDGEWEGGEKKLTRGRVFNL